MQNHTLFLRKRENFLKGLVQAAQILLISYTKSRYKGQMDALTKQTWLLAKMPSPNTKKHDLAV